MHIFYLRDHYSNVAFIYVSDDMKWGKEHLSHLSKKDIYFIGHGENEDVEDINKSDRDNELTSKSSSLDFALLSSCNHTIGSRGTFTIYASRFAGGKTMTEFSTELQQYLEVPNNYEVYGSTIKQKKDITEL